MKIAYLARNTVRNAWNLMREREREKLPGNNEFLEKISKRLGLCEEKARSIVTGLVREMNHEPKGECRYLIRVQQITTID